MKMLLLLMKLLKKTELTMGILLVEPWQQGSPISNNVLYYKQQDDSSWPTTQQLSFME